MINQIRRLRHYLGLCNKTRLGYHCHGTNQFRECR